MDKLKTVFQRHNRFGRLIERQDERDFPFYNGQPMEISTKQWIVLWVSVFIGFLALSLIPASTNVASLIPRILFLAIPLATIIYITKDKWKSLFHKPTLGDFGAIIFYLILNLIVTFSIALLVRSIFGVNSNTATDGLATAGSLEIIAFYIGTGFQLMGEEIFTIIPFLALMYFFYTKGKVTRKQAIVWALILSSIWFALAHLPTYGWNLIQVLLVIGTARIVLTLAYIRTKNLWVSFGAHLLNDWIIFTVTMLAAASVVVG